MTPLFPHTPRLSVVKHVVKNRFLNTLVTGDRKRFLIFKKYRAIFEYFDAIMVGLTATPKTDVDRNTYDFFEMEHGVPTYAYDYETAVYTDHVLVPYYNYEELQQVLPGLDRNQIRVLMRELRESEKVFCEGRTSAARWFASK